MNAVAQLGVGWSDWPLLAGLGVAIGVVTGLFGIGGGFLMTPLLKVLFGIEYPVAVGTSLSVIIGTSAGGVARHYRLGNVEGKVVLLLAIGGIAGAMAGDELLQAMKGHFGPHLTEVMHGLFIALLAAVALLLGARPRDRHDGKCFLQRLPLGPRVHLRGAALADVSAPALIAAGALGGTLTGLMGIGGGVVFVPILILLGGFAPHLAVGSSLGVILTIAVAAVVKKGWQGQVNLAVAMALLVGSSVGVQVGASLCNKLSAARLRRYFAVVVLAVALVIAVDLVSKLAGG